MSDPEVINIVHVTAQTEDGYDGTEGWTIELADGYLGEYPRLIDAQEEAAWLTGTDTDDWKPADGSDRNGFRYWTYQP